MNSLRPCGIAFLLSLSAATVATPASAASGLPWRQEVNQKQCGDVGSQLINATERVVNSVDSGEGGNYWAFDDYTRMIRVWPRADGTYCAVVSYYGRFDGQAGQTSPGASGTLSGAEDGPFQGGYRATIEGVFDPGGTWPQSGFVGTTDHACDISGDCPGRVDWVSQYFAPGAVFTYEWWGWIYNGRENGTWINAIDGNSGDILAP